MSLNTIDIIEQLVANNPTIDAIKIHSYPTPLGIEKRIPFGVVEESQFEDAIIFRKTTKVAFWDSLMLSFFERQDFSELILTNMLNHHVKRKKISISRKEVLEHKLFNFLSTNDNFAINSEVICSDGKKRHLMLLDFHIPVSEKNQRVVESTLKAFKIDQGYLLNSGRSYHFIGSNLVGKQKMNDILHKGLFYSPIIDKYWIAHQLIDHSCSLRFTMKHGIYPQLVKQIYPV